MRNTRREFLKISGGAIAGLHLPYTNTRSIEGHKREGIIRLGLIGCGGRGTGAAAQALKADPQVHLVAMGDLFADKLQSSLDVLRKIAPERVQVGSDQVHIGFDAYKKVIAAGVDVVLLTAPPYARPEHLKAAVLAGKHVFAEKPVAVDAEGVRSVLKSAQLAKERSLSLVSGFCFRYDASNRAAFGKISDGAVGDIRSVTTYRYGGEPWYMPRKPGWTDMEYRLRNWYYYDWLSGDFITEVSVHSLDLMAWTMGDRLPVRAIGTGGRQKRTDPIYGVIYDHFAIEYEYEGGIKGYHFSRQQNGCASRNTVEVFGAQGIAHFQIGKELKISGKHPWQFQGKHNQMYQTQHDELFASIRKGIPVNDGIWMAHSTMLGILGRMVAYSGQEITWEEAMASKAIGPGYGEINMDLQWPVTEVPVPGLTKVL